MSVIDQAFIRAYEHEEAGATTPVAAPRSGSGSSRAAHFALLEDGVEAMVASPAERREPAGQRRPLSAFARHGQVVEAQFKPALEVDRFRWPNVCEQLVHQHQARLAPLVHSLMAADDAGRSLIGIGGAAPRAGCTTMVTSVARMLVECGKTVAIVDGNFASPGLAAQLGLACDSGWEDVLSGKTPLAESVVQSIGDRLALLPLVRGGAAAAEKLQSIHASVTAGVLRYHYDMVLFDLGVLADRVQSQIVRNLARHCRLDGIVLALGAGRTASFEPQRLMQTAPDLATICLGVVESHTRAA
jgi:Mrp family chromosome partitioning ATPase